MSRLFSGWRIITILVTLAFAVSLKGSSVIEAAICTQYCNAEQWKPNVSTLGVRGFVVGGQPDLRGGDYSYHRVGIVKYNPFRFVEFGWLTSIDGGRCNYASYNCGQISSGGDGMVPQGIPVPIGGSPATHIFSMQYGNNNYYFYVDDVYTGLWVPVDWSYGQPVAGGETGIGRETMGDTLLFDLRYIGGGGGFDPWNGYQPYVVDYPYYNRNNGNSSFYDSDWKWLLPAIFRQ